jgi:hypothetical protein
MAFLGFFIDTGNPVGIFAPEGGSKVPVFGFLVVGSQLSHALIALIRQRQGVSRVCNRQPPTANRQPRTDNR